MVCSPWNLCKFPAVCLELSESSVVKYRLGSGRWTNTELSELGHFGLGASGGSGRRAMGSIVRLLRIGP